MATERKTMALNGGPKHRGEYAATSPRPGGGGQNRNAASSPPRIVFEYWKKRSAVADLVR